MPLLALVLLFVAVPLTELFVILKVGDLLGDLVGSDTRGALLTILLLAADSVIGAVLLRSQGRAVWRRFNQSLASGRIPHREIQDGVAVIFGGAFLITPGFLTDLVGIALLLPPSRALILRLAAHRLAKRAAVHVTAAGTRRHVPREHDVDGYATEQEPAPDGLTRTLPPTER